MSFDWDDYVYLAEDLLTRNEESCRRTSVSRAYYGVFCRARNKKGYHTHTPRKGESIHWTVINAYKNSANMDEQNVGRVLDKLRRWRNQADYNQDKTVDRPLAERAVYSAKELLVTLGT